MAKIDKIKQALKELSPEEKLYLWNLRCSEGGYQDDQIYENDEEFFNMYYANDIIGAVQAAVNGDYNFSHDYVTFNGYGNLQSIRLDRLDNFIDDKEIAEFLNENEEYLDELEVEDEEKNEVSEEEYWDNLEVLPPYYFNSINGKKVSGGFAVGEPTNHVKTPLGYRATYSGFYKKDGKYFGVGQVYFVFADEQGEPNDEGSGNVEVKTLNPDAFAKGGGIFSSLFSNREYSTGRNWTNDHRHQNKSEKYEVPMANRKSKYATGGGLGKPTYIPNEDIDSLKTTYGQTIAGKKLLDGAYATGKVKKPTMARTQFEDETYEYGTGGTMDSSTFKKGGSTPKQPIAFESSNLYFNGYAMDINGNKVVRVSFPTGRAFSIQTLGTLPKTYKAHATMGFDESEINAYVKAYGSPAQKKKLKIYKK